MPSTCWIYLQVIVIVRSASEAPQHLCWFRVIAVRQFSRLSAQILVHLKHVHREGYSGDGLTDVGPRISLCEEAMFRTDGLLSVRDTDSSQTSETPCDKHPQCECECKCKCKSAAESMSKSKSERRTRQRDH